MHRKDSLDGLCNETKMRSRPPRPLSIPTDLPTYLPTYLPTCLQTYIMPAAYVKVQNGTWLLAYSYPMQFLMSREPVYSFCAKGLGPTSQFELTVPGSLTRASARGSAREAGQRHPVPPCRLGDSRGSFWFWRVWILGNCRKWF